MRSEPGEHVGVDRRERREFLQVLVALQSPCTVTKGLCCVGFGLICSSFCPQPVGLEHKRCSALSCRPSAAISTAIVAAVCDLV